MCEGMVKLLSSEDLPSSCWEVAIAAVDGLGSMLPAVTSARGCSFSRSSRTVSGKIDDTEL